MVSSNQDYIAFGLGKHVCPGRFFAACELKFMFAHIISTYDVKLEIEGARPSDVFFPNSCVPNQDATVLFRKRANV
jgi:cytochrome P450